MFSYTFAFTPGEIQVMQAGPSGLTTAEWAAKYLVVPDGRMAGAPYDPLLTPFWARLWDILDMPSVRELDVCAAPQTGKTLFSHAYLAKRSIEHPGPRMIALPDEVQLGRVFKRKVRPLFEKSPVLRRQLGADRYAVTGDEINLANGGSVIGAWAGSASKRASISVMDLLQDEPDMYPAGAVKDFDERPRSYANVSKNIKIGKPLGKEDQSTIWQCRAAADATLHYEVRCPACGRMQRMEFERIRVPEGMRDTKEIRAKKLAWYECAECGWHWSDGIRNQAVARGWWTFEQPDVDRPVRVWAHLASWYSPFVSLSDVIAEWFEAQGDPVKMTSWWNGHAAQPYDAVISEATVDQLKALCLPELPPQTVPDDAVALTLGADMQKDHFYWSVWAHAVDPLRHWVIDYGKVGSWDELRAQVFDTRYPQPGTGKELGIWRAALDTGGTKHDEGEESRPMQAAKWLRSVRPGKIWGTKGMSGNRAPGVFVKWSDLDKLPNGRKLPPGRAQRLYLIDTDAFKRLLMWLLGNEEKEETLQFHAQAGGEYFRQLLSEKLVSDGHGREVWKRIRANHWLDCAVAHLALTHYQWTPSLTTLASGLRQQTPHKAEPQQRPGGVPRATHNPFTEGAWR